LTGYAYETVANKSIVAGATKDQSSAASASPDSAKPADPSAPEGERSLDNTEPATLGSLGSFARGTAGAAFWRRKDLPISGQDFR
jgi:hypothetical protein